MSSQSRIDQIKTVVRHLHHIIPDGLLVRVQHRRYLGFFPDLKNPVTFNEKLNWRKLYQRDPRFIDYSDKIKVKPIVASIIGEEYIIPTLWEGVSPDDIPFDILEPPYIIKTNHRSGSTFFITNKNDIPRVEICKALKYEMKDAYGGPKGEWAYRYIQPKILAERLLEMPDGRIPNDYKFFVYSGRVHFVQIDTARFGDHKMAFMDRNWIKLPLTKGYPQITDDIPKPCHYDLMVELAEKIGTSFDFARVDFYDIPSGVFFGEVTFYPAAGFGEFYPSEWDEIFGEPWKIKPYHQK